MEATTGATIKPFSDGSLDNRQSGEQQREREALGDEQEQENVSPALIVEQEPDKTIRGESNNSDEAPVQQPIEPYEMIGGVGRQRRYEEFGKHGEFPVKYLVLYRHKMKRHMPGLSDDMQHWYELFYFTKPDKAKDKDKYEQHARAYQRGRKWIAEEVRRVASLGDSNITDITARESVG